MDKTLRQVLWLSHALMLLTSLHHIYGAIAFNTPWRYHALFLAVPVIVATELLAYWTPKIPAHHKSVAFWINWVIILVFSITLIGAFEGIYNHFLKNLLYFTGVDQELLSKMFPAPTYEMPSDIFFEATGIGQAVIAIWLICRFYRLTKEIAGRALRRQVK